MTGIRGAQAKKSGDRRSLLHCVRASAWYSRDFSSVRTCSAFARAHLWKNPQNRQNVNKTPSLPGPVGTSPPRAGLYACLPSWPPYYWNSAWDSARSRETTGWTRLPSRPRICSAAAARRVEQQPTILAQIRQRVILFDRQLTGSGVYRQMTTGAGDCLFRTEFRVPIGDSVSTMLQVCDGRFIWSYEILPHEDDDGVSTDLGRVDLNAIRRQAGQAASVAFGGLPGLLRDAQRSFLFETPTQ